MKGKLITFEGGEGVGKSTQVRLLMQYLKETGQPAVFVRQPGGTATAERIREILLSPDGAEMTPLCEAYLYAAARADLMIKVIIPALKEGRLVVCDRHIDSSVAYQGAGRGLGTETVRKINEFALCGVSPDAVIFLDLPHDKMLRSKQKSEALNDRFERETAAFHARVYEGYLKAAADNPSFIRVVPCGEKRDTLNKIVSALRERGVLR